MDMKKNVCLNYGTIVFHFCGTELCLCVPPMKFICLHLVIYVSHMVMADHCVQVTTVH
uniref:Uncharacterized protein n=1 Tax=Arundo donax TaxID=35708 RepID=A0A0A9B8A7_ARUDO